MPKKLDKYVFYGTLRKILYFYNQLQKKVQVLLITSETIYLRSQLREEKILYIQNQSGENPVLLF